ncbi:aminotransferase class III-fold pyridoxal phosphate-dependent enzyme [Microbulbifer celer]|uniref:Aminotransferase class III-fold pyridoxal phosphate-dependent enzyme n=1 Tax=Microbulbifer celer TaxID=435905 RepID=A0ABW3U4V7_9GAMM|nr:aminotransferase class III-fold pyridoxal phosphate-dependent enzyme [Microbulbifer celer]UFN57906.1 aminotransferase class III-fold pyridoxal phosphate-dependent enzyme [Microbulbifer celer]
MKFGFIAHPTSVGLKRHAKLIDLTERSFREQDRGFSPELWQWRNLVPFFALDEVVSSTGARCSGIVDYMPLTAEEMLADPRAVARRVEAGIEDLKARGAEIVGLGGFTGIVGNRGVNTAEKVKIPVTTGNSLTAYAAYRNLLQAMEKLGVSPADAEVAVVGFPGSIALAIALLLLEQGCRLTLVHRGGAEKREQLLGYIPQAFHSIIRLSNRMEDCYDTHRFYVAATSTGGVIDPAKLQSGSVVVDAALPRDVLPVQSVRSDILLIDGGLISAGPEVSFGEAAGNFAPKMFMNGCLAETLILSLEGRRDNYSLGRVLPPEKVLEIGALAQKHGFTTGPMASGGERIGDEHYRELQPHHRSGNQSAMALNHGEQREASLARFRRHINPLLAEFYQFNHCERVFQSGSGCTLTDLDGTRYLDFVAGYGCLNTGHNHPQVTAAIQAYLTAGHPTFVQYVSVPYHTTLLAERLSQLAPGDLSRVFFSNSGTEAVEAAIKLALAATDGGRLLYCENGYHGKTLGALSVTGRQRHRNAFEPLLPQCSEIPFGCLESLETELRRGDVRALVIEPIQGEGGAIVPADGYLSEVRRLCTHYGALLILDEVQTGLGRTGKLFCCEWENVVPDILVLSKSLSGGAIPIGATLCSPTLWDTAYGSIDRCILHTSTFGGGNLAAATALATLDVIEEENLAENARLVGARLLDALREIAAQYPFIHAVRGRGLMLAIEFCQSFEGSIESTVQELAHRLPWTPRSSYRMLPDSAKRHLDKAIAELESSMQDMFVLRFVSKLSQEHGILTFLTANSNRIMRIQPPLVLTEAEASQFILAFDNVCRDMSTFLD